MSLFFSFSFVCVDKKKIQIVFIEYNLVKSLFYFSHTKKMLSNRFTFFYLIYYPIYGFQKPQFVVLLFFFHMMRKMCFISFIVLIIFIMHCCFSFKKIIGYIQRTRMWATYVFITTNLLWNNFNDARLLSFFVNRLPSITIWWATRDAILTFCWQCVEKNMMPSTEWTCHRINRKWDKRKW